MKRFPKYLIVCGLNFRPISDINHDKIFPISFIIADIVSPIKTDSFAPTVLLAPTQDKWKRNPNELMSCNHRDPTIFSQRSMSRKTTIRSLLSQDVTPHRSTLTVHERERRKDNEWTRLEEVFLIICFFPSAPSCTLSYLRQYYNSGKGCLAFCYINKMSLISKCSYNIPLICLFAFLWPFLSPSASLRLFFDDVL